MLSAWYCGASTDRRRRHPADRDLHALGPVTGDVAADQPRGRVGSPTLSAVSTGTVQVTSTRSPDWTTTRRPGDVRTARSPPASARAAPRPSPPRPAPRRPGPSVVADHRFVDDEAAIDDVEQDRLAGDEIQHVGDERVVAGDQVDLARGLGRPGHDRPASPSAAPVVQPSVMRSARRSPGRGPRAQRASRAAARHDAPGHAGLEVEDHAGKSTDGLPDRTGPHRTARRNGPVRLDTAIVGRGTVRPTSSTGVRADRAPSGARADPSLLRGPPWRSPAPHPMSSVRARVRYRRPGADDRRPARGGGQALRQRAPSDAAPPGSWRPTKPARSPPSMASTWTFETASSSRCWVRPARARPRPCG